MPAWTRNNIKKKTEQTTGINKTTDSDPAGYTEVAAADTKIGYLNVEQIGANQQLLVYRFTGARADAFRNLDAAGAHLTITATGVFNITWPTPLGAADKTQIVVSVGTTAAQESIFELDDVYRTQG